jgi:predicted DNA-binding ribbon-helix-helix protein
MRHPRGQPVKSLVLKRSLVIADRKTSVSIEEEFWKSMKEIAGERNMTVTELCPRDRCQSTAGQSIVSYPTLCAWRLS